jgi:hypothetical protein
VTGLHERPRRDPAQTIPSERAGTPLPPLPPMARPYAQADPEADQSTAPIPAARPGPARPEPAQPCRCDEHKYGQQQPGSGVLLWTGAGGEDLRWHMHIQEGWYEDVCAFSSAAWRRMHEPAIATARRIQRDIEIARIRGGLPRRGKPS